MPQLIPISSPTDSWFITNVVLDGTEYLLEMSWNTRDGRWYAGLAKADGTALVSSAAVVVDYPLFRNTVGPDMPKGYLMAVDTTGNGVEIAEQDDLGVKVQLVYVSEAEVDEALA